MSKHELVSARLREARKMSGLSQGQAAKLMKMHRPTVSEIEAGNRKVSVDELSKFSEIYEISTAWLLGDVPEQLEVDDPKLQLAARELSKLGADDLDRLLRILAAMRDDSGGGAK